MQFPCYTIYSSPIGEVYITSGADGLRGIWFDGGRYVPEMTGERLEPEHPAFREIVRWLDAYFAGEAPQAPGVEFALYGTPFQRLVWAQLQRIPYGQVTTYGAIAKALERETGKRVAAQAVGGAVGRNPISILIPCHRVVGSDGGLTGYGGGLWRKEYLLALERGE